MRDFAMSGAAGRSARRRSVNLSIERSLQLELPVAFLLLGCAVAVGLAAVARSLGPQTADFLVTVIAIGLLYVLALSFLTLIWCHRFVGPVIAFRRMLAALLAGDASARVQLRRGSAFAELAEDLNALAERIATDQSQRG
jgi:signal transduction histidine kinase